MKLQDVFDQLSIGEFSQLSIGGEAMGEVNEANMDRVILHVQLGLDVLFRRFRLKEGKFRIALQAGQTIYNLHSDFAQSNLASTEPVKYIKDDYAFSFVDDLNKIERVYSDTGYEMALNDTNNPWSLVTPAALKLYVPEVILARSTDLPEDLRTSNLMVHYRAAHPKIARGIGAPDPCLVNLELPDAYLEPLLFYVASRVHNPIGMVNEFHVGNSYAAKYEVACQRLEQQNLQIDMVPTNTRFNERGWV